MSEPIATGATQPSLGWRHPLRLIALGIRILFLRILTLGLYHFWGKTEVRRKIWSAVHIDDQPLEYTGTGKELFLGFLFAFFAVLLPLVLAFQFLPLLALVIADRTLAMIVIGVLYVFLFALILFLSGVAVYRARRYRLSRSRWRGIRGAMAGSSWRYGWTYFWTLPLVPLTLGWALPWRNVRLQRQLVDDTRFGGTPLRFEGTAGALYKPFALFWIGSFGIAALALGFLWFNYGAELSTMQFTEDEPMNPEISGAIFFVFVVAELFFLLAGAWYMSRELNYFAASSRFDNASFRLDTTGIGLIWLLVGNFLLSLAVALVVMFVLAAVLGLIGVATGAFSQLGMMAQMMAEGAQQEGAAGHEAINPMISAMGFAAFLFMALSFTVAAPLVAARSARYFVTRMGIDGSIDYARIAQSQEAVARTGEGLAEAFDIDGF